jgi:hypothetical protein
MLAGNTARGRGGTAHDSGQDVPRDVTDVLLWRMAARVIAAHQPQPEQPTRCASLLCAGQHYPCPPVRAARRAQQISHRVPATREASAPHQPAVADWYAATRAMIQPLRMRERPPVQRSGRTPSAALTMPGPARIRGVSTA